VWFADGTGDDRGGNAMACSDQRKSPPSANGHSKSLGRYYGTPQNGPLGYFDGGKMMGIGSTDGGSAVPSLIRDGDFLSSCH